MVADAVAVPPQELLTAAAGASPIRPSSKVRRRRRTPDPLEVPTRRAVTVGVAVAAEDAVVVADAADIRPTKVTLFLIKHFDF